LEGPQDGVKKCWRRFSKVKAQIRFSDTESL